MSTCDELRAQRSTTVADIATTKIDLAGAIAEAKQDPHNTFLAKEVARLTTELAGLRAHLAALEQQIATQCSGPAQAVLVGARITFTTHEDDLETDSYLSVFVRNQPPDGSVVLPQRGLISNRLAWERHGQTALTDRNPYLAAGGPFGVRENWDEGSTHGPFPLGLPLTPVLRQDVGIPVVDVHLLTDGSDRWMFSWMLDLEFSDGTVVTSRSDTDGVAGAILDEDNPDHMGLGTEDLGVVRAPRQVPDTDAVLTEVTVAVHTRGDTKEAATGVRVHIVDRRGPTQHHSIATALGLFAGEGLDTDAVRTVVFGAGGLPLDGGPVALRDLVLPLVFVGIDAPEDDRWSFDYEVSFRFSDGRSYRSRTGGVVLTRAHSKHAGVWRGDGFPKVRRPDRQLFTGPGIDHTNGHEKRISLAYLRRRLDQFVNGRQDTSPSTSISPHAALRQIRLHNTGEVSGSTLPASYLDVRALDAEPPAPGTITDAAFAEAVAWRSNPTDLGQLAAAGGLGDVFLVDINSRSITVDITPGSAVPLTVTVQFETEGAEEVQDQHVQLPHVGAMNLDEFSIMLRMSLQAFAGRVELFAWMDELDTLRRSAVFNPLPLPLTVFTGTWLGQPVVRSGLGPPDIAWDPILLDLLDEVVHVVATTSDPTDFGGALQRTVRNRIYDKLAAADPFHRSTAARRPEPGRDVVPARRRPRDRVHARHAAARPRGRQRRDRHLLHRPGGLRAADARGLARVLRPRHRQPRPDRPHRRADDGEPFLRPHARLPQPAAAAAGGAGRTDVDGLRGGEFNTLDDEKATAFAFAAGDTVFSPDPPHGYEPVALALDVQPDGVASMGGFVRAFAAERGRTCPADHGASHGSERPDLRRPRPGLRGRSPLVRRAPRPDLLQPLLPADRSPQPRPDGFFELTTARRAGPPPSRRSSTTSPRPGCPGATSSTSTASCACSSGTPSTTSTSSRSTTRHAASPSWPDWVGCRACRSSTRTSSSCRPAPTATGRPRTSGPGRSCVRRVVETVVASPHWERTLLVVLYDEHGGFYDHVPPPAAAPVTPDAPATYGVRVPAFVISPWAAARSVFGHDATPDGTPALHFDHTSLLATIVRRFLAQNVPDGSPLRGGRGPLARALAHAAPHLRTSAAVPALPHCDGGRRARPADHDRPRWWGGAATGSRSWIPGPLDLQAFCLEDRADGRFRIRSRVVGSTSPPVPTATSSWTSNARMRPQATARCGWLQETPVANGPFVVRCAAQPGQALRSGVDPADPSVVGLGPTPANLLHAPSWRITSPLLPPAGNTTHP